MTRKEFVGLIGASTAIFCIGCNKADFFAPPAPKGLTIPDNGQPPVGAAPHPGGLHPGPTPPPPPKLDFTIDIEAPENQPIKFAGGFLQINNTIVALTFNYEYVAAQLNCTHNGVSIEFSGVNDRYVCPAHGSKFDKNGLVISGPAHIPLKIYKTKATGNLLRVYEE